MDVAGAEDRWGGKNLQILECLVWSKLMETRRRKGSGGFDLHVDGMGEHILFRL